MFGEPGRSGAGRCAASRGQPGTYGDIHRLTLLLLLITLLGVTLPTRMARAAGEPTLQVLEYAHEFDANNCMTVTVAARGFSSSQATLSASATLPPDAKAKLTISPAQVTIGVDGNFETQTTICYPHDEFNRLDQVADLQIAATGATSGEQATSEPLKVSDPQPTIHALHTTVPQLGGCVTVELLGEGMLASGLANNKVYISGITQDKVSFLTVQPDNVDVLGGGNIAIAAQFCDLTPQESFRIQLHDLGSRHISNQLTIYTT